MSPEELAIYYVFEIKRGELAKWEAVMYWRNRHQTDYITALLAIDRAIGEVNEFGGLTEIDPFATL